MKTNKYRTENECRTNKKRTRLEERNNFDATKYDTEIKSNG